MPSSSPARTTVLAAASLPSSISFSSNKEPELKLTLTLLHAPDAVTISRIDSPFWPLVNCLSIQDAATGVEQRLPTIDVCYRSSPPRREQYWTLQPDQPMMMEFPFRPLGYGIYAKERLAGMGASKYRLLVLGMHLLQVGGKYSLAIKTGLRTTWTRSDRDLSTRYHEETAKSGMSRDDLIEIEADEPCTFRVEA